ncbi:MAG: ScyD/ScyE family protein [Chloroflexota bacterium]
MKAQRLMMALVLGCMVMLSSLGITAQASSGELSATLLVSGLKGGSGSTVGPDGMLYVPENVTGRIVRVDPQTGAVTPFATGLPHRILDFGGVMDVAFSGDTLYALVSVVSTGVGGHDVSGIYRIDPPDKFTIIADIGQWSTDNPPHTDFAVAEGVQYAMQPYQNGFIVTDGHHNRVLYVTLDGKIAEWMAFDDLVPTGLAASASSNTIYMTEAGPVPHLAENGKVMMFEAGASTATEVGSGARLLVDVEYGCCGTLYALAQGDFQDGNPAGAPALPKTGSLVRVNADGTFTTLVSGLNQPTALEFIGNTAYVITLNGEIWKIEGVLG